jgi:hypothetical protein
VDAVWKITPFITIVLTLAIAGTLNAAMLAYAELQEASSKLFGAERESLFRVDTYKNAVEYLALLQIIPWKRHASKKTTRTCS